MASSLKRLVKTPSKGPKKSKKVNESSSFFPIKVNRDNASSTSTISPVSEDEQLKEKNLPGTNAETVIVISQIDAGGEGDNFRTPTYEAASVDTCSSSSDHNNDEKEFNDAKTTVITSNYIESSSNRSLTTSLQDECNICESDICRLASLSEINIVKEALITEHIMRRQDRVQINNSNDHPSSPMNSGTHQQKQHEVSSPLKSVVLRIDTKDHCLTQKVGSTISKVLPILSPFSEDVDHDGLDFDDYRSTISGLTEATNFRRAGKSRIDMSSFASPTHSIHSAIHTKIEDFLKTETEAIRRLLSEVDNGDDESTVVEDSIRGANEAERMVKHMEREMEVMLRSSSRDLITSTNDKPVETDCKESLSSKTLVMDIRPVICQPQQEHKPRSDEVLADIRPVMHAGPEALIDGGEKKSLGPTTYDSQILHLQSPRVSQRTLFRVKKIMTKKKIRRFLERLVSVLLLTLFMYSAAFVVNWQYNLTNQGFSSASQLTMSQLRAYTSIDPKNSKKVVTLVAKTKEATQPYVQASMCFCATKVNIVTTTMIKNIQKASSLAISEAYNVPRRVQNIRIYPIVGWQIINTFALNQFLSVAWTREAKTRLVKALQNSRKYVKDRLEYAFTDRAAREQRIEEELRVQKLMKTAAKAAAEAAIKEAKELQQQFWMQTMFAGVCVFAGSVVTNYFWSVI